MDKETDFIAPATYRIQLQENLNPDWSEWFGGFAITKASEGGTLMTGTVADQAALHGLLRKTRDLGLTLVALQRMETQPEEPEIGGTA